MYSGHRARSRHSGILRQRFQLRRVLAGRTICFRIENKKNRHRLLWNGEFSPGSNHLAAEGVAKPDMRFKAPLTAVSQAFKGDKLSVPARRALGIELGIASSAPFDLSSLTFGGGMGSERLLGPEHNIQIGARIALDHIDALFSTVTVSVCYGAIAAGVLVATLHWLGAVNP